MKYVTTTRTTSELKRGDVVVYEGMTILLKGDRVIVGEKDGMTVYSWQGKILHDANGLRGYGDLWTVQGNDIRYWTIKEL